MLIGRIHLPSLLVSVVESPWTDVFVFVSVCLTIFVWV